MSSAIAVILLMVAYMTGHVFELLFGYVSFLVSRVIE